MKSRNSMHPFPMLKEFIETTLIDTTLTDSEQYYLHIANDICALIHDEDELGIISCNIKSSTKKSKDDIAYEKTMVLAVQNEVDKILESDYSLLMKMLKSADVAIKYQAGNCQQKTYIAFKLVIDRLKELQKATHESTVPLEIKYCNGKEGHFYLIINNEIVCDPWAQIAYPVRIMNNIIHIDQANKYYVYDGQQHRNYFFMDQNWQCYRADMPQQHEYNYDAASTNDTFQVAPKIIEHHPSLFFSSSDASMNEQKSSTNEKRQRNETDVPRKK